MKKKLTIYLEEFSYKELQRLLKSDFCQDRGFKMKASNLIEEMILNFETLLEGENFFSSVAEVAREILERRRERNRKAR